MDDLGVPYFWKHPNVWFQQVSQVGDKIVVHLTQEEGAVALQSETSHLVAPRYCTLPETNSSHLKHRAGKMSFLLERPPGRCYVSFGECRDFEHFGEKMLIPWWPGKQWWDVFPVVNALAGGGDVGVLNMGQWGSTRSPQQHFEVAKMD